MKYPDRASSWAGFKLVVPTRVGTQFSVCLSAMLWMWFIKGLGVMLPTLQEQFATQTWLVGWVLSIITAVICITGLLARPLEVMFGTRTVVTVSGFILGVSMVIASFSTSIVMLTSVLALAAGPAVSVVQILTRALLGRCFTTNYGMAVGIGTAGGAVGLITVGPFTQLLLDTYGWGGALLILGGLTMHLGVCGALFRSASTDETNYSYQPVSTGANEEPQVGSSSAEKAGNLKQSSRLGAVKDALGAQMKHFGFSVCFMFSFWITAVPFICNRFVGDQWIIYYVSQAEAKGFSPYDAVTFTTAGGVGNFVSKILLGVIVDKGLLKLRTAIALMITLSSSALLITPWVNSYWLMSVSSVFYYSGRGAGASLNDMYTRELLGPDLLACAFAWMELVTAILSFSLGFFPGWMYDQTGSFDWAFFILGCISALSWMALLMEWVQARCKSQQTA
ncbi:monocarboxylate transporter 12-B-like isoform X2 [Patiria miniata]|uniref:Major facilitator superfamily (MFS) profile domain-containing protein n=1 Tax=Patiria miniata TaxID=46514 RepID=A0A914BA71_PATMI|nr:monocarboxylate transporter 12-B-like isoform X2 [Patiria miniata]